MSPNFSNSDSKQVAVDVAAIDFDTSPMGSRGSRSVEQNAPAKRDRGFERVSCRQTSNYAVDGLGGDGTWRVVWQRMGGGGSESRFESWTCHLHCRETSTLIASALAAYGSGRIVSASTLTLPESRCSPFASTSSLGAVVAAPRSPADCCRL